MRIGVVGAGAVGGLLGARLVAAGHDVSVVARGATLEVIDRLGLGLVEAATEQNGPSRHRVAASDDPVALGLQDLVIVAVKEPSLAAVAERLAPLLGPDTPVLLAMNGVPWWFFEGWGGDLAGTTLQSVDPGGRLRDLIPTERVIGAVVHLSATAPEPGLAHLRAGNRLILGQPLAGAGTRVEALADTLRAADFDTEVSPAIQRDIWYKLWGNMTMNPVSALTRATTDRIIGDDLVNELCMRAMTEAAAIGAAIGCPIDESPADRNAVTLQLGAMRTSMLQDVEAGRALEVEALLGAPHEIAGLAGVEAPTIASLYGLTRLLASSSAASSASFATGR